MLHGVTAAEAPEAPSQERTTARRRRWVPWAALATAVLAVAGYGLWWLVLSTPIRDYGSYGVGFHDVEPGASRAIALGPFCLDGAGSATIDDVTVDPAGLTVVDFAVRHAEPHEYFGSFPGSLRDSGFGASRTFTDQCDRGDHAEAAVEVLRGVNGPAVTDHVYVHWSTGVRSGVLPLPVQAALCLDGEVDDDLCAPDPVPFDGKR
jgi:hypothetical protein